MNLYFDMKNIKTKWYDIRKFLFYIILVNRYNDIYRLSYNNYSHTKNINLASNVQHKIQCLPYLTITISKMPRRNKIPKSILNPALNRPQIFRPQNSILQRQSITNRLRCYNISPTYARLCAIVFREGNC